MCPARGCGCKQDFDWQQVRHGRGSGGKQTRMSLSSTHPVVIEKNYHSVPSALAAVESPSSIYRHWHAPSHRSRSSSFAPLGQRTVTCFILFRFVPCRFVSLLIVPKVSKEEGAQLAAEYGIQFFETSAKNDINVEKGFITIAREVKDRLMADGPGGGTGPGSRFVDINGKPPTRKSCC